MLFVLERKCSLPTDSIVDVIPEAGFPQVMSNKKPASRRVRVQALIPLGNLVVSVDANHPHQDHE